MAADGTPPRCALEQFALDIFHHHVGNKNDDDGMGNPSYDVTCSGAEWWCQLRPSPEGTGRYSAVRKSDKVDNNDDDEDPFQNGISFHVDKDEDLRIMCGGNTYVHPHLSTITYLTSIGPPTLILDCRVHPMTGEWIFPQSKIVNGLVSWPKTGKHTSFDGRFLHAAPPNLMEDGMFERQIQYEVSSIPPPQHDDDNDDDDKGDEQRQQKDIKRKEQLLKRRHRRVTFLVNIWLNYKPFNVEPFPASMIDKMSGSSSRDKQDASEGKTGDTQEKHLHFLPSVKDPEIFDVETVHVRSNDAISDGKCHKMQTFTWPLGDDQSGEQLQVNVPLDLVREAAEEGGNVKIAWEQVTASTRNDACVKGDNSGFCLYSSHSHDASDGTETDINEKRSLEQGSVTAATQMDDESGTAKRTRID